jgi:hypothetical protein
LLENYFHHYYKTFSHAFFLLFNIIFSPQIFTAKHAGQLKRIAITIISLISFLLSLETTEEDAENIFYDRFIQLPVTELGKINFFRHIGVAKEKGNVSSNSIFFALLFDSISGRLCL